jgi:hypothetical protein
VGTAVSDIVSFFRMEVGDGMVFQSIVADLTNCTSAYRGAVIVMR